MDALVSHKGGISHGMIAPGTVVVGRLVCVRVRSVPTGVNTSDAPNVAVMDIAPQSASRDSTSWEGGQPSREGQRRKAAS